MRGLAKAEIFVGEGVYGLESRDDRYAFERTKGKVKVGSNILALL